jgi:Primase C terminal 1 (PriCT-1)
VPTVNKKPCVAYSELPVLSPYDQNSINAYLKVFDDHSEARGLALVVPRNTLVLDLDTARAEEEFTNATKDATGIKTARGSKYLFTDMRPDLIDSCISLRDRAHSAKFRIREDAEIILEGMLCELPPGLHKDGKIHYEWIKEPTNGFLSSLPDSLYHEVIRYGETKQEGKGFLPGELERLLNGLSEGEGRNEAAIRIAGHLIGKGNTWKVLEEFLKSWNQKNKPPLSDNELDGVLESAHKYYNEKQEVTSANENIKEFKELTVEEIQARKESFKDRRLSLVLPLTHFVNVFCNWLGGLTDGYKDYQIIDALWLISSFCNYNVVVKLKQETVRPNISATILGKSTTSRKTTIVNKARQIHESVTGSYLPNEDFSIEGYLESLSQNPTQHHVRDEVAGFLAKIHKQYNEGFNELECALYDGQNVRKTLASKGNKEPKVFNIKSPYTTKLYATTPDNYFKYTEIEDFLSGKELRTLFAYPTYTKNKMALGVETKKDTETGCLKTQTISTIG